MNADNEPVFVTGNANKLKEVKAILSQGGNPIEIDSQALDSQLFPIIPRKRYSFERTTHGQFPSSKARQRRKLDGGTKQVPEAKRLLVSPRQRWIKETDVAEYEARGMKDIE